jgi:hypothetical protein
MTLIIAYPHSDAAWLLNGTIGVVSPLHLPNVVPAKKIEVLLAPQCSFPVLATVFSATFPTTVLQTKVYRNHPPSASFPSYQGSTSSSQDHFSGMSYV